MTTALATTPQPIDPALVESVLIKGDLSGMSPAQKVGYYNAVCTSIGLNPLTRPFAYIRLNGKEVLYALKDATDQLRKVHEISIDIKAREVIEGVYVVTAGALMPSGRRDESTGAVSIDGLKGENRANAMLKAETKAKRRATLSICGLGMLDETEAETIPQPLEVKAPAARIELPPGTVQIVSVSVTAWGGDVTVVDAEGVETVHKTTDRQCAELAEQLVQAAVAVTLDMETITRGVNKGKQKLVGIHRYLPAPVSEPGAPSTGVITAADIPFALLLSVAVAFGSVLS